MRARVPIDYSWVHAWIVVVCAHNAVSILLSRHVLAGFYSTQYAIFRVDAVF